MQKWICSTFTALFTLRSGALEQGTWPATGPVGKLLLWCWWGTFGSNLEYNSECQGDCSDKVTLNCILKVVFRQCLFCPVRSIIKKHNPCFTNQVFAPQPLKQVDFQETPLILQVTTAVSHYRGEDDFRSEGVFILSWDVSSCFIYTFIFGIYFTFCVNL